MMDDELWVLAWSQRQNALHVETLHRHTELNREACAANRAGDYRLLFVGSRSEVDSAAEKLRPTLARRNARAHLPCAGSISDPNHAEAAC